MGAKKNARALPRFTGRNVSVQEIAQTSGIPAAAIKRGLRDGTLDFGYALRSESGEQFRYYCPDKLVWDRLGYYNPKSSQVAEPDGDD